MSNITEPMRKSFLDVVQYNLRAIGSKIYVTRVVYFGEYYGTHEALQKRMKGIICDLRMDYSDMPITGLFLVYPTCYVHILEAWEDIIYKHYELMYTIEDNECKFGKAIPLPSYHHVHQRFFSEWCHIYMIPPTLITILKEHTLDDIQKQVSNCLMKVYTLCEYIANAVCEKSIDVQDVLQNLGDQAARYLPESTALEFLLNVKSPVLITIEDYLRMYSDMSPCVFWDEYLQYQKNVLVWGYMRLMCVGDSPKLNNNVWPPPCDIMPRDKFDEHGCRKVSN